MLGNRSLSARSRLGAAPSFPASADAVCCGAGCESRYGRPVTGETTTVRKLPWHKLASLNLLLVLAIVAAVALLALRANGGNGIEVEIRDPRPGIDEIRVDVAGAVLRPAVVTVAPGDRVIDAIELAGGLAPDADAAALNLARRLVDQDHIVVPRHGERAALLNVNRASVAELEALPGIGPVYAAAVVEARESGGAFTTTDDLVDRDVIPAHVYERIRDLIVAR